jgi:hypothetical protein
MSPHLSAMRETLRLFAVLSRAHFLSIPRLDLQLVDYRKEVVMKLLSDDRSLRDYESIIAISPRMILSCRQS